MASARQIGISRTEPMLGWLSGRLLGMSWAHLLNDGAANYLPGILPALLVGLHQPVSMAGALMGALILVQSLQPLSGYLADRIGGKSLILLGLALSTTGGALLGFAHEIWLTVVLLALIGVGNTIFHPQSMAAIRGLGGAQSGARMSFFLVGGELGRGLWPSVTSLLVVGYGLGSLWLTAIPACFTLPLLARWAPSLPKRNRAESPIRWRNKLRTISALVGFCSLRSFSIYAVVTFIPILWVQHGGNLVTGASIITTLLTVGIVGNLAGGQIADRFGFRFPLLIAMLVAAALIAMVPSIAGGALLWIVAALLGMALFLSLPMTVLTAQNVFPESRALGSGIALGASNAIGAAILFGVGLLATRIGVETLLYVVAAAAVVSALAATALPHEHASGAR
jgi:FSR family fosmidomycin resistance protein-like MFS transporter